MLLVKNGRVLDPATKTDATVDGPCIATPSVAIREVEFGPAEHPSPS